MEAIWRTNIGKILIGGCGSQVGLVFTLGAFVFLVAFCGLCAFTNVLSVGLSQGIAQQPAQADPVVETATVPGQIELLLEEVSLLRDYVLLAGASAAADFAPAVPAKPLATANESGANLRGGPGTHYNKLGVLSLGGSMEIVGRNSDSSWWLVSTPEGRFAWVSAMVVQASGVDDSIPVVTIPSLLVQPAASNTSPNSPAAAVATPTPSSATNSARPIGGIAPPTPTAVANADRLFAQDTVGYKKLTRTLLLPPESESFSPQDDKIAVTEGIKLYVVTTDASDNKVWVESNEEIGLIRGAVWSPDGDRIAFSADHKTECSPSCQRVGLVTLSENTVKFLDPPSGLVIEAPRWTQDGRLLVNAHPGEPADGVAYIYDVETGKGVEAKGSYILSSSQNGQKWDPWLPGKFWRAGLTERPDSYYNDSD